MVKEDYVSFETAKLLKEKGFDEYCLKNYWESDKELHGWTWELSYGKNSEKNTCCKDCSAPTSQMAMKWLREVHDISIDIITNFEWIRDPMAPSTDIEYPEISEFTGYYFEIHKLVPHRLLYDSPVISKTYNMVCDEAIKYCLVNLI